MATGNRTQDDDDDDDEHKGSYLLVLFHYQPSTTTLGRAVRQWLLFFFEVCGLSLLTRFTIVLVLVLSNGRILT